MTVVEATPSTDAVLERWLSASAGIGQTGNASLLGQLQAYQQAAVARLQTLQVPTRKDEEWRFTDFLGLDAIAWQPAPTKVANIELSPWTLPETDGSRLVFINGRYAPALSDTSALPSDVAVGNLDALGDRPLEKCFGAAADADAFATLNSAGFSDAAIIWVPANVAIAQPIHLLFLSAPSTEPILMQPRAVVIAQASATVELVEQFVSLAADGQYFANTVTEVWLEPNARVAHTRLQQDAKETGFHIGQTIARQARDSHYTLNAISTGAKFSRHNIHVSLDGEQTETALNGLTVADSNRLADTHSEIAHNFPYGTSSQLHKCLLGDRARGVFNGKIFVPQAAQQTNAAQLNRNLLLSPKARIDTKPQLQIVADNVKCSHGATVSQLEADEVFYLRSRGLTDADSRRLLIDAFAAEVLENIPVASLRDRLAAQLFT